MPSDAAVCTEHPPPIPSSCKTYAVPNNAPTNTVLLSKCLQSAQSSTQCSFQRRFCNAANLNPQTDLNIPTLPTYASALALKLIHTPIDTTRWAGVNEGNHTAPKHNTQCPTMHLVARSVPLQFRLLAKPMQCPTTRQQTRCSFLNAYSLRKAARDPHARKAFATPPT